MLANADRWAYLPRWGSLDERGLPELALALPSQSALPTAAGRLSCQPGIPEPGTSAASPGRAQPGSRSTALRMPSAAPLRLRGLHLASRLVWVLFNRLFS